MLKQFTTGLALSFSAFTLGQVGIQTETPQATLDVAGNPADAASLDGIIAPRLTGEELRAKTYTSAQTGALVYVTAADTVPSGQTEDVTSAGYYYFDGTKWVAAGGVNENIYNADGILTDNRYVDMNGSELNFVGSLRTTSLDAEGRIYQESNDPSVDAAMGFFGGNDSNLYIQQWYESNAAITVSGNSTGLSLSTHYTNSSAPITFSTSLGGNTTGVERMIITGEGNIGMNTGTPTEILDVIGNTRLRSLPLNGTINAHHTIEGDDASENQDQTFTATRTVVADDNGVLGYVDALPSDVGTSKVIVSSQVSGNQNIGNANMLLGNFPNEFIDINNAWTNNVFTVPAGLGGLYIFNMQSAHAHDVNSQTNWFITGILQKSIDGGSSWTNIMKDTNSGLAGSDVDNGVALNWTGQLNEGDKVRMLYHSNSSASNYVRMGSITITKLVQ